jgi:hypothetical protein
MVIVQVKPHAIRKPLLLQKNTRSENHGVGGSIPSLGTTDLSRATAAT